MKSNISVQTKPGMPGDESYDDFLAVLAELPEIVGLLHSDSSKWCERVPTIVIEHEDGESAILRVEVERIGRPDWADEEFADLLHLPERQQEGEFAARLLDELLMIANLARPGSIAKRCPSLGDFPEHDFLNFANSIGGWPNYSRLPLAQVAEWLRDGDDWLLFSQSDTDVSHALDSMSYEFLPHTAPFVCRLIFVVMGVEALYKDKTGNPKGGIRKHITGRIQSVLGTHYALYDLVDNMYTIRPELLHGNSWFPSALDHAHPFTFNRPIDFEYEPETQRAYKLAIAVLLATIQKMISDGTHSLRFP